MKIYAYALHNHAGDHVIATGAVRNIVSAHPDVRFIIPEVYGAVYAHNPDYVPLQPEMLFSVLPKITYGGLWHEQRATYGSCVEAYTRSLCEIMRIPLVPIITTTPILHLTDEEKEKSREWNGCILLNANRQTCSMSKGYPHWQEVADQLGGRIVQVGGAEDRDLSPTIRGTEDLRGRTTLRDLIVMTYGCRGVLSPPSCITNVAGAFHKPQIVLNASREPDALTAYEGAVHLSHKARCGWGIDTGCIHCRCGAGTRACQDYLTVDGVPWCRCQWDVPPEEVVQEARRIFKWDDQRR